MASKQTEYELLINLGAKIDATYGQVMRNAKEKAEDVGKAGVSAAKGFDTWAVAAGNLVANGISKVVSWAGQAVSSVYGLAESTRDYRQELAKLTTIAEQAGASSDYIKDRWMDMTAVLGDEGAITEGMNNLVAAGYTGEAQIQEITRLLEGASLQFKDTLKFEGLSDSIQEWIGSDGKNLSGNYAELLERLGYDLDKVQKETRKFSDEERMAYAASLLEAKGMGEVSDAYREKNAALIDASKAEAEHSDLLASVGAKIEPVTTAVQRGVNTLIQGASGLLANIDIDAVVGLVDKGFTYLSSEVFPKIASVLPYIKDLGGQLLTNLQPAVQTVLKLAGKLGPPLGKMAQAVLPVLIDGIGAISSVIEAIYPAVEPLLDILVSFAPHIEQAFGMIAPLFTQISQMVGQVMTTLQPLINFFAEGLGVYVSAGIETVMAVFGHFTDALGGLIGFVTNVFAGNWGAAWQSIVDMLGSIWAGIVEMFKGPINAVIKLLNWFIEKINGISIKLPDLDILGPAAGTTIGFDIPQIPELAQGGIVMQATMLIAGEGDEPEAILPLSELSELLEDGDDPRPRNGGTPARSDGGPVYHVTFEQHFNGPADPDVVKHANRQSFEEFKAHMEEYKRESRRTEFAWEG